MSCKVPPPGWWCSREEGHDGPCAARSSGRVWWIIKAIWNECLCWLLWHDHGAPDAWTPFCKRCGEHSDKHSIL